MKMANTKGGFWLEPETSLEKDRLGWLEAKTFTSEKVVYRDKAYIKSKIPDRADPDMIKTINQWLINLRTEKLGR